MRGIRLPAHPDRPRKRDVLPLTFSPTRPGKQCGMRRWHGCQTFGLVAQGDCLARANTAIGGAGAWLAGGRSSKPWGEFAPDSPLEGARFEPSVPGAKRVGSVPSRLTPRVDACCLFLPLVCSCRALPVGHLEGGRAAGGGRPQSKTVRSVAAQKTHNLSIFRIYRSHSQRVICTV